jgi:GNAT superfamily N-acetyltransferase
MHSRSTRNLLISSPRPQGRLRETLFGIKPAAEVLLAHWDRECAGFAVFFATDSTVLAQPGLYLEDLYVEPHLRGKGIGLALLKHLARIVNERGCRRLEWGVLDWNRPASSSTRSWAPCR